MFGLVQQPERGVPRAVGAQRHDVLQLLQAVPQVRPPVLLQLVVGRPDGKETVFIGKCVTGFKTVPNTRIMVYV